MDLRKQRTLKLLSTALLQKLHEKPYGDITVGEICDEAMVRRATFYRHFSGKDALLGYVVREKREELLARAGIADGAPPVEIAQHLTEELVKLISEHADVLRRHQLSPAFSSVVVAVAGEVADELAPAIAANLEARGIPAAQARWESRMTARFYASGLASALHWWLAECPELSKEEFVDAFSLLAARVLG